MYRLDSRAPFEEGRARHHRAPGPPPPQRRRNLLRMRRLRRHDGPHPGGDGRLVRLGGDAHCAVALPVRERGHARGRSVPRRLHLRSRRPDAGLVLQPPRHLFAGIRRAVLPERHLSRAHSGRGRGEDEQVQGERGEAVVGARRPGRRRPALVPVHRLAAGQPAPVLGRAGTGSDPQVHADTVEHLLVLRHLRQHRRIPARWGEERGQGLGAGQVDRVGICTGWSRT